MGSQVVAVVEWIPLWDALHVSVKGPIYNGSLDTKSKRRHWYWALKPWCLHFKQNLTLGFLIKRTAVACCKCPVSAHQHIKFSGCNCLKLKWTSKCQKLFLCGINIDASTKSIIQVFKSCSLHLLDGNVFAKIPCFAKITPWPIARITYPCEPLHWSTSFILSSLTCLNTLPQVPCAVYPTCPSWIFFFFYNSFLLPKMPSPPVCCLLLCFLPCGTKEAYADVSTLFFRSSALGPYHLRPPLYIQFFLGAISNAFSTPP